MNRLLPKKEDLFPITDDRKTYSDSPFNKEFDLLSFKDQLQVINDIIRQSILACDNPNPEIEIKDMIGDSFTASEIAIQYLKEMNIGTNHRSVLARGRCFDPGDIKSRHVITLVDDLDGNTYQFDCSPYVGYKHGKVELLSENKIYDEYVTITGVIREILIIIRNYLYRLSNNILTDDEYIEFLSIIQEAEDYPILHGYVSYCYDMIACKSNGKFIKETYFKRANRFDPYYGDLRNKQYKNELVLRQVAIWKEELEQLIRDDLDYKRQIELAQAIVQEMKLIDPSYERYACINGVDIPMSSLSPRYFMEEGFITVLIKPSSFKLGVSATVREAFLDHGNGAIGEFYPNLGLKSEQMGLKKMRLFHPHGFKYERSMTGPGDMFIVQDDADRILNIKRGLRNTLGEKIANHDVLWYDGDYIKWDPIITNLAHSTDDYSEAAMHYVSNNPEHQLMTRYMYPNPVLKKEMKK